MYVKTKKGKMFMVCLYVDDMTYTANLVLEYFKAVMKTKFEMNDLGLMKYFLGLEVTQIDKGIFIFQNKYAIDILHRFRMDKCKPTDTPVALETKLTNNDDGPTVNSTFYKRMVGSLMYLDSTRPNLMYVVSLISRFYMESPTDSQWKVGKRIMRYVVGTLGYGFWYTHTLDSTLTLYNDIDFSGIIDGKEKRI